MVIDVKECSACGQDHDRIQTVELVNPVRVGKGKYAKRFFYCPTNGKQVFIVPDDLPKLTIEPPAKA